MAMPELVDVTVACANLVHDLSDQPCRWQRLVFTGERGIAVACRRLQAVRVWRRTHTLPCARDMRPLPAAPRRGQRAAHPRAHVRAPAAAAQPAARRRRRRRVPAGPRSRAWLRRPRGGRRPGGPKLPPGATRCCPAFLRLRHTRSELEARSPCCMCACVRAQAQVCIRAAEQHACSAGVDALEAAKSQAQPARTSEAKGAYAARMARKALLNCAAAGGLTWDVPQVMDDARLPPRLPYPPKPLRRSTWRICRSRRPSSCSHQVCFPLPYSSR